MKRTVPSHLKFILVAATLSLSVDAQIFTDDFNDNTVDSTKWNGGFLDGNASFAEQSGRVEYLVPTPHADYDQAVRDWAVRMPIDKSWEATVLTAITVTPGANRPNVSIGLAFRHPDDPELFEYFEQYLERTQTATLRGFISNMDHIGDEETNNLGVTHGAVRLAFDAATQVITGSYDRDGAGNDFGWTQLNSIGLAGSGGITRNEDWNLTRQGGLLLSLEAFSERLAVPAGTVWVDDFKLTIFESAPRLSFTRTGNSLVLTWPASATGFSLYQKTSLNGPAWTSVPQAPVTVGDQLQVTLPISGAAQFFQLIQQP